MNQTSDSASVLDTAAATASSIAAEFSATVDSAAELTRAAARLVDQRVRERPWHLAVAAGAIGVVVGLCLRGR